MPDDLTPAHRSIEAEIRAKGPITFARFMEIALYGEHGYYTSHITAGADYATSPQMHPAFGALIAGYLYKAWQTLNEPNPFHVIELGAGDGNLSKDILDTVATSTFDSFKQSLTYHPLDLHPRGSARPIDDLPESTPITGCIISNELLDAFPTHIFTIRNRKILELYVNTDENHQLHFIEDQPSTDEIPNRVDDLASTLPDGYRGEVNLRIQDWATKIKSLLKSGYVLTIDYGHDRDTLYHPTRREGSLRCYHNHVLGQNPFRHIGQQDITSHVDFTEIDKALLHVGFERIATLQAQRDFLFDLGFGQYSQRLRSAAVADRHRGDMNDWNQQLKSLNSLVDTRGLGNFRVAQHSINAPKIDLSALEDAPIFPLPSPQSHHLDHIPYD